MLKSVKIFLIGFLILLGYALKAQNIGLGGEAIYNFQTKGIGFGARAEIPYRFLVFAPQASYFPSFNKVHEFYTGLSVHANLFYVKTWVTYAIAHAGYNGWINASSSALPDAKFSNWCGEVGLGARAMGCLYPFAELRYNFKWYEASIRIGLAYNLQCRSKNKKSCTTYQ